MRKIVVVIEIDNSDYEDVDAELVFEDFFGRYSPTIPFRVLSDIPDGYCTCGSNKIHRIVVPVVAVVCSDCGKRPKGPK